MSDRPKISFHIENGKMTTKHNERSAEKPYNERTKDNIHWDRYGFGSSTKAEFQYYNDELRQEYNRVQEGYRRKGNKYKMKPFYKWMYSKGNCPKEAIIQLGDMEHPPTPEYCTRVMEYFKELDAAAEGFDVLSIDLHLDEATPHLHVRFVVRDLTTGKVDYSNGLQAFGFERPFPDSDRNQHNNEMMMFTAEMRNDLEDLADEMGYNVDRERDSEAKHLSVKGYKKAKKKLQELNDKIERAQAELDRLSEARRAAQKAALAKDSLLVRQMKNTRFRSGRTVYSMIMGDESGHYEALKREITSVEQQIESHDDFSL